MFTIENILSLNKRSENSTQETDNNEDTHLSGDGETQLLQTTDLANNSSKIISRPIPRRMDTIFSPSQMNLHYPRLGTPRNALPNTSFSYELYHNDEHDLMRPQSVPLDLHTPGNIQKTSGNNFSNMDLLDKEINLKFRRSPSPPSKFSESPVVEHRLRVASPHYSHSHMSYKKEKPASVGGYVLGHDQYPGMCASSSIRPSCMQLSSNASSSKIVGVFTNPNKMCLENIAGNKFATSSFLQPPERVRATESSAIASFYEPSSVHSQLGAPRMSAMPLMSREVALSRGVEPMIFRHLPPLSPMLRSLMEGRHNRMLPFHMQYEPGENFPHIRITF